MADHPKAFISHASEDKDRFVLDFATKLRQKGIDAWLDRWEIKPGDSLIDRIFEDGIKNANVFIVVLSKNSINKAWVREELDSGMVKKIEMKCRLIPIVLDDCDVPSSLGHLLWVRIPDLANYDSQLVQIVNTITGATDKPPLGPPPRHTSTAIIDYLPDLTKIDNLVFDYLCREVVRTGDKNFQVLPFFYQELNKLNLSQEEIDESLEILDNRGIVEIEKSYNDEILLVKMRTRSFDIFLRKELTNYGQFVTMIVSKIVNEKVKENMESNRKISHDCSIPLYAVDNIFELLESKGLIEVAKSMDGTYYVTSTSAELKRMLRG